MRRRIILAGLMVVAGFSGLLQAATAVAPSWPLVVVAMPAEPTPAESDAAREVCRFLQQCTGQQIPIVVISNQLPDQYRNVVVVGGRHRSYVKSLAISGGCDATLMFLKPGEYHLQTVQWQERKYWLITGGDDAALQNGVRRFAELLGFKFENGGVQPPRERLRLMPVRQEPPKGAERLISPPQCGPQSGLPSVKETGNKNFPVTK